MPATGNNLPREPEAWQIWKHYKGGTYLIVCIETDEETMRERVVYKSLDHPEDKRTWGRWREVFLSQVTPDSLKEGNVLRIGNRFERIR